jgi:hypothetical protein
VSTTLGDVRQQVEFLTSRPDRKDAIHAAINQILRKLVGSARVPQALYEQVFDPTQYLATGSTTLLSIPLPDRFNAVSYAKLKDGCPLSPLHPNQAETKSLGLGYYVSGANLLVNSGWDGAATTSLLIGWYLYPPRLIVDSDTNWALDRLEHLVIDLACSYTMAAIGNQQSSRALANFGAAFQQQEISAMIQLYEES